jgi:hypothetical protein
MIERTTIRLPADLLALAKRRASEEGRTLTALIEDGLRRVVANRPIKNKPKRRLPRISKAKGGTLPGIDLTDISSLEEAMDIELLSRS